METREKVMKKVKRRFQRAWLHDERFNSWIRNVSSDDSLFHCVICTKNFSCGSLSNVIRHAESVQHKRNIGKYTSSPNNDDMNSKPKSSYSKVFKQQWLEIEQCKPWLREAQHDINSFFCTICNKIIAGGLSQIYRHAECKIHKDKYEKSEIELNETDENLSTHIDESFLSFEERKKTAEIRYAALVADKNISHESAKIILNFFKDVGKDPNILKSMSMGRTKCTNIISNVLCPVETDRVVQNIQNTKFSIFIDETSDISNEKWMTFHVRYVNNETLEVHSQLVKLIDIDAADCSAEKLFNAFKHEMWKLQIPFSNIVALSCDNASVMTGKHLSFKKKLEEMCKNVLTLSCPCHSAALVAHAACAKLPQICEEFVKKVTNYINSSPKRSAIFREFIECFQERDNKILKLAETRWLSHHACIERLLESWDTIKHFLHEMVMSEKTQSGENLLCMIQNVDIKAYLLFLKYILYFFNTFNAFFQAVETRIHLLQPKSIDFLSQICTNFLKPEVLKDLPNVIFRKASKVENHKSLHDINLGLECEEYLCYLIKNGYANVVTNIRENCLQFYVIAAEEIYKRLPIKNTFLSKLKIFLPHIALFNTNRETSFNDLSFIAATIGGFDENGLKQEWFALSSDFTVLEKQNFLQLNFDNMWKKILQRRHVTNDIKYPNLKSVLNSVRALPNSNADSERIFSLLTDIKTKKRNKLSSTTVNAICVLKSALKTRRETILDMKIDAKHLSLMSSDKLYANIPKRQKRSLHLYAADNDIAGPSAPNNVQ